MSVLVRYAILDTDFVSKANIIKSNDRVLADEVMDFPGYRFYCHQKMKQELGDHGTRDSQIWLERKITEGVIRCYDDEHIIAELKMYVAMNNATRSNTNDFIDGFDYKSLPTYGIEHLIGLARRDNVSTFSSEAERIFREEKRPMTKTMVQRVARYFMVNSKHIKQPDTQRLNAKLFNEQLQQDRLLIEQQRNKGKK